MKRVVPLGLLAALAAADADAAVSVFTSLADWQAAAGPAALEDFSGSPVGVMSPGLTDIGAFSIFLDKNGADRNLIGNQRFTGYIDDPTTSIDVGALVLRFDFDTPLLGFAGDWFSMTNADRVTVTLAGATVQFDNFLFAGAGDGFLGFVSTVRFGSLQFGLELATAQIDGEAFALDNARLATGITAAVSEPSAIAMLCLGLIGAGALRRRG